MHVTYSGVSICSHVLLRVADRTRNRHTASECAACTYKGGHLSITFLAVHPPLYCQETIMANPTTHVVLCAPPKPKDAPSFSGFCEKLEVFLRYCGVSYEHREVYPFQGPKKKVPFAEIRHDEKTVTVPDSHFIIRYLLENKLIKDPDDLAELTSEQRAESRAFQAYVEETLYSAVIYERWLIPENFEVGKRETFANLPWFLQYFVGWYFLSRIRSAMWAAGMGRHSWEEVQTLQREVFDALEVKLRKHKYFHGDERPSRIDLTVYGFLANILTCKGNPYFTDMVLKSTVLSSFVKEMTTTLFPEYKDLLKTIEGDA